MTGSTSTSIWKNYSQGTRLYCGHVLREGYVKNVKLDETLFTPTTKDEHDRPISCAEIVEEGLMSKEDLEVSKVKNIILLSIRSVAEELGFICILF